MYPLLLLFAAHYGQRGTYRRRLLIITISSRAISATTDMPAGNSSHRGTFGLRAVDRLPPGSLVPVDTFAVSAMLSVFATRRLLGGSNSSLTLQGVSPFTCTCVVGCRSACNGICTRISVSTVALAPQFPLDETSKLSARISVSTVTLGTKSSLGETSKLASTCAASSPARSRSLRLDRDV